MELCEGHNKCALFLLQEWGSGEDASAGNQLYLYAWERVKMGDEWGGEDGTYTLASAIWMACFDRNHSAEVGGRRVDCMVSGTRDSDLCRDPCVV